MPKLISSGKLLTAGLHVVYLNMGTLGRSVRDIVQAAGVPQGSLTNHFRSKETFCLLVLERYFDLVRQNIEKTLRNDATTRRWSGCGRGWTCKSATSNKAAYGTVA